MKVNISITGIADVNRILESIAPREAKNLMRATVQDIAVQLAVDEKKNSPDDSGLMDSITKAKRERGSRDRVESSVVVGGKAFYWRFLEYGDGPDGVEHAMFLKALQAMRPNIDRVYMEAFGRKLEARLARERKRLGV
jgi:hypothetical protein